jgi:hypothetical protein
VLGRGGADLRPDVIAAEMLQREVALVPGDEHEPVALGGRADDRRGDLTQQLDRPGERQNVLVGSSRTFWSVRI